MKTIFNGRGHSSRPVTVALVAALMMAAGGCRQRPLAGEDEPGSMLDIGRDAASSVDSGGVDRAAFPSDGPSVGAPDVAAPATDGGATAQDSPPAIDAATPAFDLAPPPADGPVADGAADVATTLPDSGATDAGSDVRNPCWAGQPNLCMGQCTNVKTDVRNCGGCGNACPKRPNADSRCVQGKCVETCQASWADCKTVDVADGCETRIDTSDDCGECGRQICSGSRFIGTCVNGAPVCGAGICRPGYGNCDPSSNDCETPWTSAASSGACFPASAGIGAVGVDGVDGVGPMFVAVAPDGVTYVAGFAQGMVDLDPTNGVDARMVPFGSVFLIRLGADGTYAWGRVMAAADQSSSVSIAGLAVGTDGAAAVTGSFAGTVDMDPGAPEDLRRSSGGDLFVTKVSAAGALVWTKIFPTAPFAAASMGIAAGVDGGFVFMGRFTGPINLDPGSASDTRSSSRVEIPFIVGLGGDGAKRWVSTFDQIGDACGGLSVPRLATAPNGALFLIGYFYGECDLAPGSRVDKPALTPYSAAAIIKLDASGGYVGSRLLRGPDGFVEVTDLAATGDGTVYAGGSFEGTIDYDDGVDAVVRTADVRRSGFLMKMTADLGLSWVSEGIADVWIQALEPTPDKGVLAAFVQENGSLAIMKLDDHQQPRWTMPIGGVGMETQLYDLAIGGGMLVFAGTDRGGNDLDPGAGVSRVPVGAGFLARFRF